MPTSCCALNCTNRKDKGSRKKFFRIPAEPGRRAAWLRALKRSDFEQERKTRPRRGHHEATRECAATISSQGTLLKTLQIQITSQACLTSQPQQVAIVQETQLPRKIGICVQQKGCGCHQRMKPHLHH
ncbi:uncharacterized protein LOC144862406 [Branchiostoma floridae x Branchiostoma japonicum]